MNYLRNELSTFSFLNQSINTIMPAALSTLIQKSFQDLRIGKIASGVGLTILGLNLMVTSGIPKTLKSRYWADIQNKDTTSKAVLRCGVALAALMITSFGIYSLARGILELTTQKNYTPHEIYEMNFSNHVSDSNTCNIEALKAKEQLLSCPEGQKLWDEVSANGTFTIRCATPEEVPTGAEVWVDKRVILFSENKELLNSLIFELNNLKRAEMPY